jgi:hypothetical protein
MGPLALLILLIAYVPTHAMEASIPADDIAGTEDTNHLSRGLNSDDNHDGDVSQTVGGLSKFASAAVPGGVESVPVPSSPQDMMRGPELYAEGYPTDAHALARVAPTTFSMPRNATNYIPWSIINSTDPKYMRAPPLIQPKVRISLLDVHATFPSVLRRP